MHGRSDFLLFIVEVRVPKSRGSDPVGNAHQSLRDARLGCRYSVHHRAFPYCRQVIRLWNWVQRGDHNSGILVFLHARSERIGNALRIYGNLDFCSRRSPAIGGGLGWVRKQCM